MPPTPSENPALPKIALGKTGLTVSRLALGGFHQVEISSEVVHHIVDLYLEFGGNYVETARSYGRGASEEKIGKALEGRRDRVVLASKSTQRKGEDIRRELEESLKALRTDRVDFYFLHGVNSTEEFDVITGPGGALEALLRAKDEGLVRGIGFSSHRPPMYLEGLKRLPLSVILIWCNYLENQYLPEIVGEIFPKAREAGVGITAMKPLADGFLYRSVAPALAYALGVGAEVLVCGMNAPEHVRECAAAAARGPADEAQRAAILRDAVDLGRYVCRQCGQCPADLMELFRLEGYVDRQMIDYLPHDPADYALRLRLSNWFALDKIARERFAQKGWSPAALLAEAEKVTCPYQINVPRKTRFALGKLKGEDLRGM